MGSHLCLLVSITPVLRQQGSTNSICLSYYLRTLQVATRVLLSIHFKELDIETNLTLMKMLLTGTLPATLLLGRPVSGHVTAQAYCCSLL